MVFRVNLTDDGYISSAKLSGLIEIPDDQLKDKSDQEKECLMWEYAAKYAEQMHLALEQNFKQI